MIRVLFVCSANRLRSPTAEQVFSQWRGVEADSAGTARDAAVTLSGEHIAWADLILVMERHHRSKVQRRFRKELKGKRLICLEIPDNYDLMQPELIRLLEARAGPHLRAAGAEPAVGA